MKKLPIFLSVLLIVSLICCGILTYLWINRSISLGYLQQAYQTELNSVENIQTIIALEWKGMPEEKVYLKLQQAAKMLPEQQIVLKKEGSTIWFNQIPFNIKQGKLDSVGSTNR